MILPFPAFDRYKDGHTHRLVVSEAVLSEDWNQAIHLYSTLLLEQIVGVVDSFVVI